MKRVLLVRKAVVLHTCFILLMSISMNFVLDAKNAHSFSLFEPGDILGPSIVGTWEETDYIFFKAKVTFSPDGKILGGIGGLHFDIDGRYTIKNGLLIFTDRDGTQHVSKISINKDKLTIKNEDGEVTTLRRAD